MNERIYTISVTNKKTNKQTYRQTLRQIIKSRNIRVPSAENKTDILPNSSGFFLQKRQKLDFLENESQFNALLFRDASSVYIAPVNTNQTAHSQVSLEKTIFKVSLGTQRDRSALASRRVKATIHPALKYYFSSFTFFTMFISIISVAEMNRKHSLRSRASKFLQFSQKKSSFCLF